MADFEIVFIIGAGASVEYGFPIGFQLKQEICDGLLGRNSLHPRLVQCGFDQEEQATFSENLGSSPMESVDAFLESNPRFIQIGKAAIAGALIPYEKESRLGANQWHSYLFRQIWASAQQFPRLRIGVVSFNYDRSFDWSLFRAVKSQFGVPDDDAIELYHRIPIVHPYGSLGLLPFESGDSVRAYTPDPNPQAIAAAASCIRIISDQLQDDPEVLRAKELVASAERIVFLGFGFHPLNVQRLGFPISLDGNVVRGTGHGLTAARRRPIEALFEGRISLEPDSVKCLPFLENLDWIHSPLTLDR